MTAVKEIYEDPGDWIHGIPQRIEDLGLRGETLPHGITRAFYRSGDENVNYIETRALDSSLGSVHASIRIVFKDDSSYSITWAEGAIFSLGHHVPDEVMGRDASYELPYSGGRIRHTYTSGRTMSPAQEMQGYLNLRNILTTGYEGEAFIPEDEVDESISRIMQNVELSKLDPDHEVLDVLTKDVDPADINLHEMLKQIHDIDPDHDFIDPVEILTVEVDPQEYAYMRQHSGRLLKVVEKLERNGKSQDEINERVKAEMIRLTRTSPHTGQRLHIEATNIRKLGESDRGELTKVTRVNAIPRFFGFTEWEHEETGSSEVGIILIVELTEPYPAEESFTDNSSPLGPVAFIPARSIVTMRRYPSLIDESI